MMPYFLPISCTVALAHNRLGENGLVGVARTGRAVEHRLS